MKLHCNRCRRCGEMTEKKSDRVYINTKESGILGLKHYEQLLMLLSISDTPIEDLILYLK